MWGLYKNLLFYILNKTLDSASTTCLVRPDIELMDGSKTVKIKVIFNSFSLQLWKKCRAEPVYKRKKNKCKKQKSPPKKLSCNSYTQFKMLIRQLLFYRSSLRISGLRTIIKHCFSVLLLYLSYSMTYCFTSVAYF